MAPGYSHTCQDGLECVNTMGPYIADAPGSCHQVCQTFRDTWGNCVPQNCLEWNDGCNTCNSDDGALTGCTEVACYGNPGNSRCEKEINRIPSNCASWYDGCNTCMVNNGELGGCTMMMCFRQGEPHCQSFHVGPLNINDICYRFCEDGSQTMIERETECPSGTQCLSDPNQVSMVVYDTCGDRTHKCISIKGH